jgi:single-stranded DNA-binding protein
VVAYGDLARICYPYFQAGSGVFICGRLLSRKRDAGQRATEIVAQNVKFLSHVNWEAGDAERDRRALPVPIPFEQPAGG